MEDYVLVPDEVILGGRAPDTLPGGGLGALSRAQYKAAFAQGNAFVRSVMPPSVKAAINASPLSAGQKRKLKNEPLTFFYVLADFGEDKVIEFIRRTRNAIPTSKRPVRYKIGGRTVMPSPRKGDTLGITTIFLTVANAHPIEAVVVAAQMVLELGQSALKMTNAALKSTVNSLAKSSSVVAAQSQAVTESAVKATSDALTNAAKTGQSIAKSAEQIAQDAAKAGQKATEQAMKTVSSWFGMGALGGEPVTAGAGAATGATAAAAGVNWTALLGAAIEGAIALAPIIVPVLLDMAKGAMPQNPTAAQVQEANAAGLKAQQAMKAMPPEMQTALTNVTEEKILGLPPVVVYAGGAAIGGTLLWLLLKSKR